MSIRCAAPTWLGELIYQKETSTQAWPQNMIDTLLAADQALPRLRTMRTRYCSRLNNLAERAISFAQGQAENFGLLSYLGWC